MSTLKADAITAVTADTNLALTGSGTGIVTVDGLARPFAQVLSMSVAASNGTTGIPWDDTVPVSTEGTEIGTQAITVGSTSNKVLIIGTVIAGNSGAATGITVALFRGSTCIASVVGHMDGANDSYGLSFSLLDSPSTAGSVTYSLRAGSETASSTNWVINKHNGGGSEDQGATTDNNGIILIEIVA